MDERERLVTPPGAPRLRWLARLVFLWALVILARLVDLQISHHAHYQRLAKAQHEKQYTIQPLRGTILDRTGQPLAISVPAQSVCVNPVKIRNQEVAAGLLAPVLGLDREALRDKLLEAARRRRGFLWVKRKVSAEESERLRSYKLEGVEFREESARVYPKGLVAAHVVGTLGFSDRGGDTEVGTAGIEQALEIELRGSSGRVEVLADSMQRRIESLVSREPVPGANIGLTIDERIQFAADRELKKAVEQGLCETGSIVVMDPRSGDILAMANFPTFDPNVQARDAGELAARANLALFAPFEPGSVFKIITMAAALETTGLRPSTPIYCGGGVIRLFGQTIHDTKAHGTLTMAEVLARSSNIGAIQVGLRVGERNLLRYIRAFGFGRTCGLPLAGEASGMVRELAAWGKSSIGYVAMGHEISTTSAQLAQAVSVIANGGLLMRPRVVAWRQVPGRRRELSEPVTLRRVLKPETSIVLRQMMEGVVLHGTGKRARLAGYSSGGKTGSAQIFDRKTGRYTHRYNASFAGFAPVQNPQVVVVVTLHGASQFGGAVAAPLFREVAGAALRVLGVRRDLIGVEPPDNEPVDVDDLAIADRGVNPPVPVLPAPAVDWARPGGPEVVAGPRVPDFSGKSLRLVLAESVELGMQVDVLGTGLARAQFPAAGTMLAAGERVRVVFAR